MKIIKTKNIETVTEEITVENGTYYFSVSHGDLDPSMFFKVDIYGVGEENYADVAITSIQDIYDDYVLTYNSNVRSNLPQIVKNYFTEQETENEIKYKCITEKVFEMAKERIKNLI